MPPGRLISVPRRSLLIARTCWLACPPPSSVRLEPLAVVWILFCPPTSTVRHCRQRARRRRLSDFRDRRLIQTTPPIISTWTLLRPRTPPLRRLRPRRLRVLPRFGPRRGAACRRQELPRETTWTTSATAQCIG